jgi:ribulose 1,5-bisphosphate carboxylase large subunit-like protein
MDDVIASWYFRPRSGTSPGRAADAFMDGVNVQEYAKDHYEPGHALKKRGTALRGKIPWN